MVRVLRWYALAVLATVGFLAFTTNEERGAAWLLIAVIVVAILTVD